MVEDHYERLGFQRTPSVDPEKSTWILNVGTYIPRNQHIAIELSLEIVVQ